MRALLATMLFLATPGLAADRLLIGNKGENTLSFVDLNTGRELGRAATGRMPHEIAVSPDGRTAAVVAYGARSIDLFDIATRAKLRTIDLSSNDGPHGLIWLRDGRLLATTERSRSIVLVDARTGTVQAIETGQPGHMVAVTPDARYAFTSNIQAKSVTVVDLRAGRKLHDIAVDGRPEGIAVGGGTLWVADLDGARVWTFDVADAIRSFDAAPRAAVATGKRPIRVLVSPDGRQAVTSNNGDGTLTVIDARGGRPTRTIDPAGGGEAAGQVTILFGRGGKTLYVAETGRNTVAELAWPAGTVTRRLPAGAQGDGLAIARGR